MAGVTPEQAFADYYAAVFRYLHRRIGHAVAEELAAETFATAFSSWDRFDRTRPVGPWLYGIATNLLRHHRRDEERKLRAYARTGVDPAAAGVEDDAIRHADARAQLRALAEGLAQLRAPERDVLLLHAWAELSDDEIAAALSLPLGTVKSRLSRGRARLGNHPGLVGQEAAR
jgi:RNA polymerase sigma factor (sigma-70 family)